MAVAINKRSVMTLFCDKTDIYGHQIRFVLAEKGVMAEFEFVKADNLPQELLDLNPYGSIPTLIDRDLTLHNPHIALEYLDERFPHPPLMPVYPIVRANSRLTMHRMKEEWYRAYEIITNDPYSDQAKEARKLLQDDLTSVSIMFKDMPYFMSEEFSLCDCYFAPLLWRIPSLNITLPKSAEKNYASYMSRVFERSTFIESLTDEEKSMRP